MKRLNHYTGKKLLRVLFIPTVLFLMLLLGSNVFSASEFTKGEQKGRIKLEKRGEIFWSVEEEAGIYQPAYKEIGLAGVVFDIFAVEDIYTPDGALHLESGELVNTVTTDDIGLAATEELFPGEYKVVEREIPTGMAALKDEQIIELTYAGQECTVIDLEHVIYNERQKVQIELLKYIESDGAFQIGNREEYLKVRFGLFAAEELVAGDGTTVPADGLLEIITVNENGYGESKSDLPFGTYYVQEIETDHHYILNDNKYEFTFEPNEEHQEYTTIQINEGEVIENTLLRGKIRGLKTDKSEKPLAGALIGLFYSETPEFEEATAIKVYKTDERGRFAFDDIPFGRWLIREIKAPVGYVLSEEIIEVMIAENEQVLELIIESVQISGSVEVRKTKKGDERVFLEGAEFTVYHDRNSNGKYDQDDEEVGKMEETTTGIFQMIDLVYGDYLVRETKAPPGYVRNDQDYAFQIQKNGAIVMVETEKGKGFQNHSEGERPRTGDFTAWVYWWILLVISVGTLLWRWSNNGKRRKNN